MIKKIGLLFLFLSVQSLVSQETEPVLSLKYENALKIDVLKKIESLSKYQFFFVEDWLDKKPISGDFKNTSLPVILETIFKETVINYYIYKDRKVILTRNSIIYDSLPKGFLEEKAGEEISRTESVPVFYIEQVESKKNKLETIKLGKKTKANRKDVLKLTGTVKNKITGEPMANVVLSIKDKNINTTTNSKGVYELNLPAGENFVEIKSLGTQTETKRIVIYNDEVLNFDLEEVIEVLDEVIVDAERRANIKEVVTGITKIKVEEIKTIPLVLGERDILKVALTLPGIKNVGEGSAGYSVRGGKEDQNLILLDEVTLYNPSHFFGIFSALNPFTTGNATIYTGSIPAEYGGRLSSVFDIRTKEGNKEKFSGEASIGPVTSNVSLEIPIVKEKASLVVGARGTYSDWILKSLDDEALSNSEASFYDFVLKYNHKLDENNAIEATGHYSKDAFSITSDSIFNYSNRLFSVRWDRKINEKNKASLRLSNSQYQFNIHYDAASDRDFDVNYTIHETQLKLKVKYDYNTSHKLTYGTSLKAYSVNPGSIHPKDNTSIIEPFTVPKEKALESAVFISDKFDVSEKLVVNAGFRYSFYAALGNASPRRYTSGLPKNEGTVLDTLQFSNNQVIKTYGGPEARLSTRYFLTPDLSLKASFNNTYQYIHTLSNNTSVSPTDTWKLSDYHLKPQRASQFSLGVFKNLDDDLYELSLEGYYKKSQNILDYKVGANLFLNEYIETEVLQGEGKAYGLEFLLKKKRGKLNGWLSYSYSRSFIKLDSDFAEETVNGGNYFPSNFDKPHDVSLVANYKLTKRYSFSANFAYQTGRPITFPTGNYVYNGVPYVAYSDRNAFRIPDYYRLDIGINIEGNHKIKKLAHSFWNFSIYNVLGRNNPYSVFFVSESGDIKAYKSSIFSIPIPTITYNLKF